MLIGGFSFFGQSQADAVLHKSQSPGESQHVCGFRERLDYHMQHSLAVKEPPSYRLHVYTFTYKKLSGIPEEAEP